MSITQSPPPLDALRLFLNHPSRHHLPTLLRHLSRSPTPFDPSPFHALALKLGLRYDPYIRTSVVSLYGACGGVGDALRVFEEGLEGKPDVAAWNTVVMALVRGGFVGEARRVFDGMRDRSVASWSCMISGYVRHGRCTEAFDLFYQMQASGVVPNSRILVSLLGACERTGALEQGEWAHGYIRRNGIEMNGIVVTALIDMYCKCGCIGKAMEVFENSNTKAICSWNSMISGLALHGLGKEAIGLFSHFLNSGLRPDNVTFVGVLSACNHSGMVSEARAFFKSMAKVYGVEPRIEHYGCMVDLLGRAGYLEEAEDMILTMPLLPDVAIWGSLLSACRSHGNVEMGERAAKKIMEMDPMDSGGYVLMANAYAGKKEFDTAMGKRMEMKQRRVGRNPGCSMVEVDGVAHEFVVGEKLEFKAEEIFWALDCLHWKHMGDVGQDLVGLELDVVV